MSNYDEVKALIERISGQASVITVMRIYVDICGDLETAAVLSQCVFWSDKGSMGEGWFYKSRDDWNREIGIKRSALEGSINRLKTIGVVETKVMPAKHNSPTTFYRVNMNMLTKVILEYLQSRLAEINQSNTRSVETSQSTGGRSAETSQSDWLKPTNPSVDFNQSSYSSLQHSITSEYLQDKEKKQNEMPKQIKPDASLTQPLPGQDMTPEMAWQSALGELQLEMTRATFETWVKPTTLLSVNGTWKIGVSNSYAKEWLENRLVSTVKRVLTGVVGESVQVEFVVVNP